MLLKTSEEWFDLANIKPEVVIVNSNRWCNKASFKKDKISKTDFLNWLDERTVYITRYKQLKNQLIDFDE